MVYKQKGSKYWWYKFTWNHKLIRESTRQTNKRVAEQVEAAHRTALAKGEVGIRERKPTSTFRQFAENDFLPFVRSTFAAKPKTLAYYENGVARLLEFDRLATQPLDTITGEAVAAFVSSRRESKGKRGQSLQTTSLNRELQVLRRMFRLVEDWGKVQKAMPKVKMLPGERHRDRVLTSAEEELYFRGASTPAMDQYAAPTLAQDVAIVLLDCGLRPEECFRLRKSNVLGNTLQIDFGKTANARRRVPTSPRVKAVLDMRLSKATESDWLFPAKTRSGHVEPSSLKKQHLKAISEATRILREETATQDVAVVPFELYTFRHTCLTRWAPVMDPWTLGYLAGHRDMNITKRYVHPQEHTVREAMQRANAVPGGHSSGHRQTVSENATTVQ